MGCSGQYDLLKRILNEQLRKLRECVERARQGKPCG